MDLNKVPKQFCENITVGFSKEYFVMGMMTGEAAAFFAMTPQHMKRLSQYLAVQISDYEQKNGAIAHTRRGTARGLCSGLSHGKISRLVLTADTRFFLARLRSIRKDQQSQKIYVNHSITGGSSKARK